MPIISVILGEGRSVKQKRDLCRALTDAAVAAVQVRPDQVRIIINDIPLTNYSVSGITFAEHDIRQGSGEIE